MRRVRRSHALLLGVVLAAPLAVPLAAPAVRPHPANGHGAGAGTEPAGAPPMLVSMAYNSVTPPMIDVVTGATVKWTNDSVRVHTVTADDGTFDSGRMATDDTYTRRFDTPGAVPYYCALHPGIQGVVTVRDLLLEVPSQAAAPNKPFPLSGRTALPAGTPVSIEADSGAGFAPVASANVGDDGDFAARITPSATASYRAVAGAVTSDPVALLVLDRQISLTVRRTDGRVRLQASVTPASSGGRIVLQLFLPERFGWWPVQTATLGRRSGASFTVHTRRAVRARVRYTLPDGATPLATSHTVRLGHSAMHHR